MGIWTKIWFFIMILWSALRRTKKPPTRGLSAVRPYIQVQRPVPNGKVLLTGVVRKGQNPRFIIRKTWEVAMEKACLDQDEESLKQLVNLYGVIEEENAARAVN